MSKLNNLRIATTALSNRIVLGEVDKNGLDFKGETKEVTSDVLKAVVEYCGKETMVLSVNGQPKYEISVKTL